MRDIPIIFSAPSAVAPGLSRGLVQPVGNALGFFLGQRIQRGVAGDHAFAGGVINHTPISAVLSALSDEALAVSFHAPFPDALCPTLIMIHIKASASGAEPANQLDFIRSADPEAPHAHPA